jgi:hypothetical protein
MANPYEPWESFPLAEQDTEVPAQFSLSSGTQVQPPLTMPPAPPAPSLAPKAMPVDATTTVMRAQPVTQPSTPPTSSPTWDKILQNAAPKYAGEREVRATVFATPKDLADYAIHHSLKRGDNGIGHDAYGTVDTAHSYGVAVPKEVMAKVYGGNANDPSTTAHWRTARAQINVNGKTYVVPISDDGPAQTQKEGGPVTDLTSDLAKGIPGWMSDNSDGPVQIKLLPPGSGPDYLTDRKGWQAEQENIGKQLIPTPLGSSDIVRPVPPRAQPVLSTAGAVNP